MKTILYPMCLCLFIFSGVNAQTKNKYALEAKDFISKREQLSDAPIIDVRTAKEFSAGHLKDAKNYDFSASNFQQQIATIDKAKPVFVYCLSGARSASAAAQMRAKGFSEVYELQGGLMKWRSQGLPEVGEKSKNLGLNLTQFQNLLNTDKLVLVDFYADWCAPCKKMEPYLKEIATDMEAKVVVLRINADDSKELCKQLGVSALPVLQLYKNQNMVWSNMGFIEKEAVLKQLN